MKISTEYDWVVIGEHPAALLSGCIAARLGYSVLWVKHYPMLNRFRTVEGMSFDPESAFFSGWLEREGEKSFFRELLNWLAQGESTLFDDIQSVRTQLLTREVRTDIQDSIQDLSRLISQKKEVSILQTFFSDRMAALSAVLDSSTPISPDLFVSENWNQQIQMILRGAESSRKNYQKAFNRRELISFIQSRDKTRGSLLLNLIQDLEKRPEDWGEPEWILQTLFRSFFLEHQGVQVRGGVSRLFNFLVDIALKWGVSDRRKMTIQQLFIEKDKFLGLQLKDDYDRSSMIGVKGGVIGCSLDHLKDLVQPEAGATVLRKSPQPSGWKFSTALRVNPEGVPPGLGPRSIWVDRGAPHVEFECVSDNSKNEVILYLRTLLPFRQYTLESGYQRRIASRLVRLAKEQIPFLERHIQEVYPSIDDSNALSVYSYAATDMIPENLRILDRGGVGTSSGLTNLFVATGESYPELGSLGPYLSGIQSISEFYKQLFPKAAAV